MQKLMHLLYSIFPNKESGPLLGRWCRPDTNKFCNPFIKAQQADYDNGMHTMKPRQPKEKETRDDASIHSDSFRN